MVGGGTWLKEYTYHQFSTGSKDTSDAACLRATIEICEGGLTIMGEAVKALPVPCPQLQGAVLLQVPREVNHVRESAVTPKGRLYASSRQTTSCNHGELSPKNISVEIVWTQIV